MVEDTMLNTKHGGSHFTPVFAFSLLGFTRLSTLTLNKRAAVKRVIRIVARVTEMFAVIWNEVELYVS